MRNDMINFSASTIFPIITTLKEIPKIELVAFVKRTEEKIEEAKKKCNWNFKNGEKVLPIMD